MKIQDLRKKKIAILGYGVNNKALLKWLVRHGAENITICDKNPKLKFQMSNQIQSSNVKCQTGEKYLDNLEKFDVVFRTPGIPYLHPKIQEALKKGVEISSQTKLFFDLCSAKIIGITGTKGKGTTATLISEILKLQCQISNLKSQIYLAGNIGKDPFEFVDKLTENDWVILELSSFQLQDLERSPHVAVILNVTSDHLDYHKNTKEYQDAKLNIVRHQNTGDFTVINLDYSTSFKFAASSPTKNDYYFSARKSVDLGAFVSKGEIILRTEEKEYKICKTSQIKLLGKHNLENICAAAAASFLAGADKESIKKIITTFTGRAHRLEFIREYKGVKFYNDSASTNPDTAIAAIKSFNLPIILIAGGSDKGADYSELGKAIKDSSVKAIITMGKTGPKIVSSIKYLVSRMKKKIKIYENTESLKKAAEITKKEAKSGDVVLLSPASASFDMFKNYEERGNIFKKIVKNLK